MRCAHQAATLQPPDSEFTRLIGELSGAVGDLERAAVAGREGDTLEGFKRIGAQHCNRCHFKMRWHVLEDVAAFPDGLP